MTAQCLWGRTNEHVDCVPVAGPKIDGQDFCEFHAECVEAMNDPDYQIHVLMDDLRYR